METTLKGWLFCHDLLKENHLLIAGSTGSGKSVLLNHLIWTLYGYDPNKMNTVLIDLKRVELSKWKKFPHTWMTATEKDDVLPTLSRVEREMERRFKDMEMKCICESDEGHIYVIIDETAYTLSIKGVEEKITDIMRLGRAAHIHMILCTQSPNRAKGGGLSAGICQNVTCAIGLHCKTAIESRR